MTTSTIHHRHATYAAAATAFVGTPVAFTLNTAYASVETPTRDFQNNTISAEGDAGELSTPAATRRSPFRFTTTALVGLGAATLPLAEALAVALRRRRARRRPN